MPILRFLKFFIFLSTLPINTMKALKIRAECVHFLGTHTYSFSINLKILLNKHESKYKTQLEVLKKMGEFKYMKAVCLTDLDSGILYFSGFICGA